MEIWYVMLPAHGWNPYFFLDPLKGFAVGDKGVILETTNGGSSWTTVTAPIIRDFNAIAFINANTGYIVGGSISGQSTILRTINGGANWAILKDTIGGKLNDISFADSFEGYIAGDSATVLKTLDGGLNWSPIIIDSTLTGNEEFRSVKFYDKSFGAVGGKSGILYIYTNIPVEAYTLGLSQLGTSDATLQGGINTHTKSAKYSFVYSRSPIFTGAFSTSETFIQNDSLKIVSGHISGLITNTTYYYFLKVTTSADTLYGDTLNFIPELTLLLFFKH